MKTLPFLAACTFVLSAVSQAADVAQPIVTVDPQKVALDQITQEIQTSIEAQKVNLNGETTPAQLEQMRQDMETFRANLDAARPKLAAPAPAENPMPQDPRKTSLDQAVQEIQASMQKTALNSDAMKQNLEAARAKLETERAKWSIPVDANPAANSMPQDPRKTSLDQATQDIQASIEAQRTTLNGEPTSAQLEQMRQDVESFRTKLNAERAKFQ